MTSCDVLWLFICPIAVKEGGLGISTLSVLHFLLVCYKSLTALFFCMQGSLFIYIFRDGIFMQWGLK